VAHLREDRRHINERDLWILKETLGVKLNLEMSIAREIVSIACKLKPAQATLVPERRQELTTEGGLDVISNFEKIRLVEKKLKESGIPVSLFIDPDKKQIDACAKLGIKMVELHTGRYADARNKNEEEKYFKELRSAASYVKAKKMLVFAGHGLNYNNVSRVAKIKEIEELNIGYSIVCRAVLVGMGQAVRQMKALIK
jgi:pyridoxine 5-phosphate synthase